MNVDNQHVNNGREARGWVMVAVVALALVIVATAAVPTLTSAASNDYNSTAVNTTKLDSNTTNTSAAAVTVMDKKEFGSVKNGDFGVSITVSENVTVQQMYLVNHKEKQGYLYSTRFGGVYQKSSAGYAQSKSYVLTDGNTTTSDEQIDFANFDSAANVTVVIEFNDSSYLLVENPTAGNASNITVEKYADTQVADPIDIKLENKNITEGNSQLVTVTSNDPDPQDYHPSVITVTQPDGDSVSFSGSRADFVVGETGVYSVEANVEDLSVNDSVKFTSESESGTLIVSNSANADVKRSTVIIGLVLIGGLILVLTRYNL